jgi:hypothetical protein
MVDFDREKETDSELFGFPNLEINLGSRMLV